MIAWGIVIGSPCLSAASTTSATSRAICETSVAGVEGSSRLQLSHPFSQSSESNTSPQLASRSILRRHVERSCSCARTSRRSSLARGKLGVETSRPTVAALSIESKTTEMASLPSRPARPLSCRGGVGIRAATARVESGRGWLERRSQHCAEDRSAVHLERRLDLCPVQILGEPGQSRSDVPAPRHEYSLTRSSQP